MKYITKKEVVLPNRKKSSRKGDNGKVLIIGGSKEYVGALALAGLAALRSGADWVTVAAPEKVGWAINTLSPDLVVYKFKGEYFKTRHIKELLELEKKHDIILIGNGLGKNSDSFIRQYIKKSHKKLVIDADAIKTISTHDIKHSILTPHRKEFETFMKNSKITTGEVLRGCLKDNVILLKGEIDKIITHEETFLNRTGNAGMTKAGTGDVLAGLCAGFYAQTNDNIRSAKLAAYYNGVIGDILLKKKKGYSYLASDMVNEIKRILK